MSFSRLSETPLVLWCVSGHLTEVAKQCNGPKSVRALIQRTRNHLETDVFEKILGDAHIRLTHTKRSLDENRDRIRRWRNREFWADESPRNKRELQEMLKEARDKTERLPTRIRKQKRSSSG